MANNTLVMPHGWKMSLKSINGKDGTPAVIRIAVGHINIDTHAIIEQPLSALSDGMALDLTGLMAIALGIGSEKE